MEFETAVLFADASLLWLGLALMALFAGFVDAVVGGGGLVQIPALFAAYPAQAPATLFGTNKFASIMGTGLAAVQYARRVELPWRMLVPACIAACACSFAGARVVSLIPVQWLRPVMGVLLVLVALYTLKRKELGRIHQPRLKARAALAMGVLTGGVIGFYDGFFGPGTGAFLIFVFVRLFGFDFLHASASAKIINVGTNLAALAWFVPSGNLLWGVAVMMALCNMAGSRLGSRMALARGAGFVRGMFLAVLSVLILRFAWDTWRLMPV